MEEHIGKYRLIAKLGQGAMGEVYHAHDPVLNRDVAVKTMAPVFTADDDLIERFRREAQSAARLNHPNIVTVFDFGEANGKFFMAMELLEGVDLKDVIVGQTLNDLWDKLDVMEQVSEGLSYAHSHGVVHRDLKPANIRIQPSGRVKIMDFGLARLDASDMTRAGMVMGTPNYMSPEQVRGERVDARSDVFSLGTVFYELLSGHKAFYADSMHSLLFKVVEEEPEPVRTWIPDLPAQFVRLVEKALSKDPALRFQHAGELCDALKAVRRAMASGDIDLDVGAVDPASATVVDLGAPTMIDPRGATSGATALDVARVPVERRRVPRSSPTLSGRAGTRPPQPTPPYSRTPLYAGGVAVAALALGAAGWMLTRPGAGPVASPAADVTSAHVGALTAQLVGSQIELARVDLENKDYRGAIAQAEKALRLDPESSEAREVVAHAKERIDTLERTAAAAKAAFARGDSEAAARALSEVLALDPRHPVAGELTAALNQHFRRQAEEAGRMADDARRAAETAGGASQESFALGARTRQEADALLGTREYAVATQRLMQSRDAFERARRAAEIAARPPSPRVIAGAAGPAVTLRPGSGGTQVAGNVPPPVSLPPVTAAPVTTLPPVTAPPVTLPGVVHDAAIRSVIGEYARAIQGKDIALFRTVKPNLSGEEEKRLADAFKAIKSQVVGITIESIQVDGDKATVRVWRQDTINGKQVQRVQQTFRLAQSGESWTIQAIGQ